MKSIAKRIFAISIFIGILLLTNNVKASGGLRLKNLDYDVTLNSDGSADIIETWNVYIEDTNTLFKNFEVDKTKYKEITNVKVQEITQNGAEDFTRINRYKYHVDKNCYYALMNNGKFEIAWGAHAKDRTKTYKISYKVIDAIKNYNDCSEFYWKFINTESDIPVNIVEGTIKLPVPVENIENLRVWAHGPLNGNIEKISADTVKFEVKSLPSRTMLETRLVTPIEIFSKNTNISSQSKLNEIISQEQRWADEANKQRQKNAQEQQKQRMLIIALLIVTNILGLIALFAIVKKIKKYKYELQEFPKIVPEQEIQYYRDIPNDDATPAEASFLYYFKGIGLQTNITKVISATMLDLCLKKYIEFETLPNNKNQIKVIIKNQNINDLKMDEALIMNLLLDVVETKRDKSFTMKEFKRYVEKHATEVQITFEKVKKEAKKSAENNGNYDGRLIRKGISYSTTGVAYIFLGIISIGMMWLSIIPAIMAGIYCFKLSSRYNTLTQKGVNEKSKWEGLKKYMEEFSLLKEREVPELVLWEKYLVYATAFGIADKVLKQLKVVYPQLTEENMLNAGYTYMYLMYTSDFSNSFVTALNNSISNSINSAYQATSNYSSGIGGGGGFSSGGGFGGGGGRNGRKINPKVLLSDGV